MNEQVIHMSVTNIQTTNMSVDSPQDTHMDMDRYLKGDKGDKGEPFKYEDFTSEQLLLLKGEKGDIGERGISVVSVEETVGSSVDDEYNIITITLSDGTTSTIRIKNGSTGAQGPQGEQGIQGIQGIQGPRGADGTITFEELTDEQKATLKGEKGDRGEQGLPGEKGDKGETGPKGADGTMTFEDLTDEQRATLKGDKGDMGEQGLKGDKGDKGDAFVYSDFTDDQLEALRGPQGIQGAQGERGLPGDPGAKGDSYIITQQDKQDIATIVDTKGYVTRNEVSSMIAAINQMKKKIVADLPTSEIDINTIYFVPKSGKANDNYNEYLYIEDNWELIGSTEVDLSGYLTIEEADARYADISRKLAIGTYAIGDGPISLPNGDALVFLDGLLMVKDMHYSVVDGVINWSGFTPDTDSTVTFVAMQGVRNGVFLMD